MKWCTPNPQGYPKLYAKRNTPKRITGQWGHPKPVVAWGSLQTGNTNTTYN